MLPAHVPLNVTFALVVVVGVIVYFRLPQPVAGFAVPSEDHVPANASIDVVGPVGPVGFEVSSLSLSLPPRKGRSQPAENRHARTHAAANRDFILVLIVTYDAVLYGFRRRLFHYPYGIYGLRRA